MALASKGIANESSRILMLIMTSNGCENGSWFSPADENHKSNTFIIEGMKKRYLKRIAEGKTGISGKINVLIWIDVYTKDEIERFKP